jgi:hypothetical protein
MDNLKNIQRALLGPITDYARMDFPNIPVAQPNPLILAAQSNHASEFYKRLVKWISDFDASLDQAHEVGVRLVSFGQNVTFRLSDMGYCNPSLISFRGATEDGNPVELIQHVTQISVLLMRLPRPDPSAPKQTIGFAVEVEGENGDE